MKFHDASMAPVIYLQRMPDAAPASPDRDTEGDATVICRRPRGWDAQGNVGLDVGQYPVACSLHAQNNSRKRHYEVRSR